MKRISLVLSLLFFACSIAIAQRTVTGTVSDESGETLIGASVLVKGTTSGTVTDIDGKFSLNVPANAELLVVSYTGFATSEVPLTASNVIDITMSESAAQLNEVVVTALGIRKEKKALGYSVATIGSGQVENRVESDVGRILRGKAAGVDITQTSGVAGSGTNIIIRGYSSISGSNQPLFVVDGVPFNTATNTDRNFVTGGATASSRFLDLDPNNIAEINVLKGLSATVLYGEQGANGVILVTTKNGQGGANAKKGFEISVTQGVARTEIANLPDYQNSFGNGFSGNYGLFFSNWGPAFDVRGSNIQTSLNIVSSTRVSPPASVGFGSNPSGASVFANVLYTPRSVDLAGFPFQNPIDGSQVYYRGGNDIQNPRWGLANMADNEDINRYFGNVSASYQLTDWLTASYKIGVDTYTQNSRREINKGGSQVPDGQMLTNIRTNTIIDQVLNLSFDTDLSESFNLSGTVGVNDRRDRFERNTVNSTQQFIFGLFDQDNFIEHQGFQNRINEGYRGVFGSVTAGYNRYLYLTASARNDWSSTLEEANRSILYPSLSVSFVPTDAFESLQGSRVLNYLKLRAGYGTSARFPDPYQTRRPLGSTTRASLTPGGTPLNTNFVDNRLGNLNLEPELLGELEFGVEGRFLNNRVGIDLSIYDKQSSDLLVDLDLDPASGYSNTTINAAEVSNKGIEVSLNLIPVKSKDFTWDMTWNLTSNRNEVISIADGVDQIGISGFTNLGNFAIPGQPFGAIQGSAFVRGPNGGLLVNAAGEYEATNDPEVIGDPNPRYQANWLNTLSYKGVNLSWQFSYTDGGDIYSVTTATMLARGLTVDTDFDRFLPLILPGEDAEGNENTVQGYAGDYFFAGYFGADEGSIFDATVIRLREVSLSYSLPSSLLEKLPFGSISLRLVGENLWYYAPNFPVGVNFDPEVSSLGVGNGRGFDFLTGPTAKKYGATISLTF